VDLDTTIAFIKSHLDECEGEAQDERSDDEEVDGDEGGEGDGREDKEDEVEEEGEWEEEENNGYDNDNDIDGDDDDGEDEEQEVEGDEEEEFGEHDFCSKEAESRLPKRVLAIGMLGKPTLKLIETDDLPGRYPYATLSHCWGDSVTLKTTIGNLGSRLRAIAEDDLPVVFAQAIEIARRLAIPYLWIDSLCIVQDSRDDWERESVKMCDYYSHSYLNIAAGASANHSVPLLGERDARWSPVAFPLTSRKRRTYNVFARRIPSFYDITQNGVLYSRAWAYQESALAPRTIHFTNNDLAWECRGGISTQNRITNLHGDSQALSWNLQKNPGEPAEVRRATRPGLIVFRPCFRHR